MKFEITAVERVGWKVPLEDTGVSAGCDKCDDEAVYEVGVDTEDFKTRIVYLCPDCLNDIGD